ncbi:MAG TPA: acyl-CoA dehydrogenase family protein [Stellaceae bacterium]|nr:acyl-CoA dehydrogenase family protein [Stellaceae bacterium]
MEFAPSTTEREVEDAVGRVCARFGDEYWLGRDRDGVFPHEFHGAIAAGGWLGICIPEEFGGAGLGIAEAAVMMRTIAQSGAAMAGASSVHMNIFGLNPVVRFGTAEQKQRHLPPLAAGKVKACFAVTEPNAGLDTGAIETRAEKKGARYVVTGQKVWTSTAQVADTVLLLARTSPRDAVRKHTDGLSLFYTALDRHFVDVREIEKMGRKAVDSNMLFIDGLEVPEEDRVGAEGQGFEILLHGLNPERILVAAEAVGIGHAAIARAASYAKERIVFGRPIGANQGVQHPLAERWMALEAARLMAANAAWRYDQGLSCGAEANAAKYLASEAAIRACETAMLTLGGYGYAKEYHVERYLREAMITRLAPVTPQLILCHIAERVLGLPKSY